MQQTVLTLLAMVVAMTMAADVTAPAPAAPGPAPAAPGPADSTATMLIFVCSAVGILFSIFQFYLVSQVGQKELGEDQSNTSAGSLQQQNLLSESDRKAAASRADLKFIYETIREGAQAFLWAEYKICFMFIFAFGLLVFFGNC